MKKGDAKQANLDQMHTAKLEKEKWEADREKVREARRAEDSSRDPRSRDRRSTSRDRRSRDRRSRSRDRRSRDRRSRSRDRRSRSRDRRSRDRRHGRTPIHVRVQADLAKLRAERAERDKMDRLRLEGDIASAACQASYI